MIPSKKSLNTNVVLNCAKARREIGWKIKHTLDKGIIKTLKWYKKNKKNFEIMKKCVNPHGNFVQDHEFIYPFYRLLEDEFDVAVGINEDIKVKGILGTDIPPNKNHPIIKINEIDQNYNLLIILVELNQWKKLDKIKKLSR